MLRFVNTEMFDCLCVKKIRVTCLHDERIQINDS
jgi:hypothetical protein